MAATSQILLQHLTELKKRCDWIGIYKKFQPLSELPQNELIWNNPKILSDIGFACTKLAETGSIQPEIIINPKALDDFLKTQAEYRKYAQSIQERCVELEPLNPLHPANVAYIFYQNIIDLTQHRGRRDGNLRKEIEKFLTAIDKALALDAKRVNDLYRKGRVLTRILPDQILWSKSYEDLGGFTEKFKKANDIREKGIQTLLLAKNEWEMLRPDNPDDQYWYKRYRKEYIKTLYTLSQAYYDKTIEDWDESVFTLNLRNDISDNHKVSINNVDLENIDLSIKMIKACCKTDCPSHIVQDVIQNQQGLEKIANYNGEQEGVDKLYSIGKFFFAKYWILSGNGLKETFDANEAREVAERYLQAAMKCHWSPQKTNQDKRFIAERLARVFISKEEYDKAISIIESIPQKKLEYVDPYILHTWAIAMLKSDKIPETQTILNIAKKSKQNKELWLTHFLKGCAYLETGEIGNAQEQFELAQQTAERVGKKNVDSLLIAKAFVEYRSDNVPEALKFLEEAQRLNPFKVSIGERIEKWKQSIR